MTYIFLPKLSNTLQWVHSKGKYQKGKTWNFFSLEEILIRGYLYLKQILGRKKKKVFLELNYSKTDK